MTCKHRKAELIWPSAKRWCPDCGALGTDTLRENGERSHTVWQSPAYAITPKDAYRLERVAECCKTMYECAKCGHVRPVGAYSCECKPSRETVMDVEKLVRKVIRGVVV